MSWLRIGDRRGQSLVEFSLVAPLALLLIFIVIDFSRGFFYYTQLSEGSREAARQAVLAANSGTNSGAPACNTTGDCQIPGVLSQVRRQAAFGVVVVYSDSSASNQPPSYGTFSPGSTTVPGTITLTGSAGTNVIYLFVYQLGTSTGAGGLWATGTPPARTGNHELVVVDLKMRWQPATMGLAGLGSSLVLDAQTVERMEF